MPYFLIFLLLIIVLITAFLLLKLKVSISYDKKLKVVVNIGFLKKEIKKIEKKTKSENNYNEIKKSISDITDNINASKYIISKALKFSKGKIYVSKLDLKLVIGTSDAAQTAILTGSLWGLIYNLIAFFGTYLIISIPNIEITPQFNEEKLEINFEGIFETRIVHIIIVGFAIYMAYLKKKNNFIKF